MSFKQSNPSSRRRFLTRSIQAGAVGAAWMGGVHSAVGSSGIDSGKVRLASVGVGGMGAADLGSL
nr:hypothetical protein [Pirellula sp.]